MEDYVTGAEAGRRFGIHHGTCKRWSDQAKIEFIENGGIRKYSITSIEKLLAEKPPRKVKAKAKVLQSVREEEPKIEEIKETAEPQKVEETIQWDGNQAFFKERNFKVIRQRRGLNRHYYQLLIDGVEKFRYQCSSRTPGMNIEKFKTMALQQIKL